jgi:predicted anti-sigma-YlaC factor YlaD
MSGATSCREIRHALGVYVLGAIDPADRAEVDEHLATCADCREELAGLAGLPALLRRVPQAEAERLAEIDPADPPTGEKAPDELLPPVLARMAQARRVRRWRELAAAAAVVVLAVGAGAAGATLAQSSSATPPAGQVAAGHSWQTVASTDAATGVHLTVKYTPMSWGTLMSVRVSGIPAGTVCGFQVTDSGGRHWQAGGWTVRYQGWYPATTSLADANLRSFEVTSGGKVLARAAAA